MNWFHGIFSRNVREKNNRTLSEDLVFRRIIFFGGLTLLCLWFLTLLAEGMLERPCFSSACLNNAAEIFSFHLKYLAGLFVVAALYTTIFRSGQTTRQIEISVSDTVTKNYFEHRRSFKEIVDEHFKDEINYFVYAPKIYSRVFPLNCTTEFFYETRETDDEFFSPFDEICREITRVCDAYVKSKDIINFYKEIQNNTKASYYELGIDDKNFFIVIPPTEKASVSMEEIFNLEKTIGKFLIFLEKIGSFSYYNGKYSFATLKMRVEQCFDDIKEQIENDI